MSADDREADRYAEVVRLCREDARRLVADWPPLTPAQRDKLTVIFSSARGGDHRATA